MVDKADAKGVISDAVVAHLDKSHITVHTYPETHPDNGIATFRADIDVSTCGVISPLKALNYLIESLESDIVVMDYRVRGFTRDEGPQALHRPPRSIRSGTTWPEREVRCGCSTSTSTEGEHLPTKMHMKEFDLDTCLFEGGRKEPVVQDRMKIEARLKREIESSTTGATWSTDHLHPDDEEPAQASFFRYRAQPAPGNRHAQGAGDQLHRLHVALVGDPAGQRGFAGLHRPQACWRSRSWAKGGLQQFRRVGQLAGVLVQRPVDVQAPAPSQFVQRLHQRLRVDFADVEAGLRVDRVAATAPGRRRRRLRPAPVGRRRTAAAPRPSSSG